MEEFFALIEEHIKEYGYSDVKKLCVSLAIEKFKDLRRYPKSYSDAMVIADLNQNSSKIAMAAIEIDAKVGVENQLQHNDNGTNRTYSNSIMAYSDVIGFVN